MYFIQAQWCAKLCPCGKMCFRNPANRSLILERGNLVENLKVLFFPFIFFNVCIIICYSWVFKSLLADTAQMKRYNNEVFSKYYCHRYLTGVLNPSINSLFIGLSLVIIILLSSLSLFIHFFSGSWVPSCFKAPHFFWIFLCFKSCAIFQFLKCKWDTNNTAFLIYH